MRPLWVPFVAMVPICTLVVLAANALGIEPYGRVSSRCSSWACS